MPIIVEDGSNVADANSFVSLADYKTYASARGYSVPADDAVTNAKIILSSDYLLTLENEYKGQRTNADQALSWPRECAVISTRRDPATGCIPVFPDNEIPSQLIQAQCEAVNFLCGGGNFMPTQEGAFVVSEKVDVIETKYSERINTTGAPSVPAVDAFLAPLLNDGGDFGRVRTVRI